MRELANRRQSLFANFCKNHRRKVKAMYYRLKPGYLLRGWDGTPWMLVKRPQNWARPLKQEEFQALVLCDGETDLSDDLPDASMQEALKRFEAEGIVETQTETCALDPEQYYQYYDNRYVKNIIWSITGRCNFRCRHCYMDAPEGALGELSTEQAFDFIDQMAECGVLQVDLTGGEVFVRKDFWQLVDKILSYHIVIGTVYTNGWLLNEKVLNAFEQKGIKPHFSISFDGIGWHDWMRGVPGAEKAALQALKLCQERGYSTDVEMCLHRGNQDVLPQTIEALRNVGVRQMRVGNVALTDLWRCHSEGNTMTDQEYIEAVLPYIEWYYRAGRPMDDLVFSNVIVLHKNQPYKIAAAQYDGTEKCLNCYLCGSARMSCYITPEGRLLPCMPMTASPEQGNFPRVQDIGLKQGLSNSYYMQFVNGRIRDLLAANSECNACAYRYKCGGGCRAVALLEGDHNLMGCDRTKCMLWKNGYVDRIRQTAEDAIRTYGGISPEA